MDPPSSPSQEFLLNAYCTRCGYDLRSNNVAGPCPKCGLELPYAQFISGLANANPVWLDRVYMGITGLMVALVIQVVEQGLNCLLLVGGMDKSGGYLWSRTYEFRFGIEWFSVLFLLAAREVQHEKEPWHSPRNLLLWLGWAWVAAHLLWTVYFNQHMVRTHFLSLLTYHSSWILETGAVIVMFLYILRLGQRAGDPFLKQHLPIVVSLIIVSHAFGILMGAREMPFSPTVRINMATVVQTAVSSYAVYVLLKMRRSIGAILSAP